jgi:HJR/Mrr/RecB family endonuclease
LKGFELQSLVCRLGLPLTLLLAGITVFLFALALAAGAGPVRGLLFLAAFPFTLLAGLLLFKTVLARRFLHAYRSIAELRRMDPLQFEHYTANLFRKQGFQARVTVSSGDDGVDIVLKKNGIRVVAQCKRYAESKPVVSEEMQRFIGSMQIYGVRQGFFVATTRFTAAAVRLAKANGAEIIDDAALARLIRKTFPRTAASAAAVS